MRALLQTMYTAQKSLLRHAPLSAEHRDIVGRLRAKVPAPVLAHFLRLVERGQAGVALVQHGVCSACHIRLPLSTQAMLTRSPDLHLCESCSAYLLLAEEPQPTEPPRPVVTAVKRGRRAAAVVST